MSHSALAVGEVAKTSPIVRARAPRCTSLRLAWFSGPSKMAELRFAGDEIGCAGRTIDMAIATALARAPAPIEERA